MENDFDFVKSNALFDKQKEYDNMGDGIVDNDDEWVLFRFEIEKSQNLSYNNETKFGHRESVLDAYNKRYGKKNGPWRVKNTKHQLNQCAEHVSIRRDTFERGNGVIDGNMATVSFATATTGFLVSYFFEELQNIDG